MSVFMLGKIQSLSSTNLSKPACLVKIEDQQRGAADDLTFLGAPRLPVKTYDPVSMNTSKFETFIESHRSHQNKPQPSFTEQSVTDSTAGRKTLLPCFPELPRLKVQQSLAKDQEKLRLTNLSQ